MNLETIYPVCRSILGEDIWTGVSADPAVRSAPGTLPHRLTLMADSTRRAPYIADLATLEWRVHETRSGTAPAYTGNGEDPAINPTLSLVTLGWRDLSSLLDCAEKESRPEAGEEHILVWKAPRTGDVRAAAATQEDLLVLKMVEEGIDARTVADMGGLPVHMVHDAVERARAKGLIVAPSTRIVREDGFGTDEDLDRTFLDAHLFTLQWHLTQACDLFCKHCYDRSDRDHLGLEAALGVLEDFDGFCRKKHVRGAITFTGGNPLLYPDFVPLYEAAADYGFGVAILGNPTERTVLEKLVSVRRPDFFQLSLEGLEEQNDRIRGIGHFRRTLGCLDVLADLGVYSMVMLTLTKENMDQVIPLGELLRGKTDLFHFNRLSRTGEGAALESPSREEYRSFLEEYVAATRENPILGLKDNLINPVLARAGEGPFGGCTGHGCGAAFDFMTLLPDGEVHACRKFPSLIGNVLHQGLLEIYDSEDAGRYRRRPEGCMACPLRSTCGGCLAVIQTHGLDPFKDRDPLCFY